MTGEPAIPLHRIPLDRVSVLIDSIYAFAMTLLVTTIDVPSKYEHASTLTPVQAIVTGVLPDLAHFFIAFIILAIFWYFEHQRFRHLAHLDRPLLCLNIMSLAFVCLLPFTTNVAGDFPFDYLGAILFEVNILVIGTIAFVQWVYISHHADLTPDFSPVLVMREIRWALVFPALAIAGIIIAGFRIPWSTGIFLLAPFIMAYLFWKDPVKTAAE